MHNCYFIREKFSFAPANTDQSETLVYCAKHLNDLGGVNSLTMSDHLNSFFS
jgi:hypothetical protein